MSPSRRRSFREWPEYRPRLPGPGPRRASGRKPFGATWWGQAWVEALEERASLDPNRLPRGRTYARQGAVGELDVRHGEVLAEVQGSRRAPYRVRVRVRPFSEQEWAVVLDALAAQVGHAAALLEGELVPEIAGDVRSVGLDLLPGSGEVQPRCTCPDWADPCKHSAAVCFLVADELDRDPFHLFVLRGKSRDELLAGIRGRRHSGEAGPGTGPAGEPGAGDGWDRDVGIVAREAWGRRPDPEGPAVSLPPPRRHPGRPVLVLDPAPDGSGVDAGGLAALAADAARRAWELARGGSDSGLELSSEEDAARWAAGMIEGIPSPVGFDELARRTGLARGELFLRALAWKSGGRGGLAALLEAWDPEPSALAWGRAELGTGSRTSRNRVTFRDRQLRLGRDGRWYVYRKVRGAWQPETPPAGSSDERPEGRHSAGSLGGGGERQ